MNIKELQDNYQNAHVNTTLINELELIVRVKVILNSWDIVIEDDSGSLVASTTNKEILKKLKGYEGSKEPIKVKGCFEKDDYDILVIDIREVL